MRRNKVDPTADGEIKLLMRQTSIVHRDAEHEVDHEVEISTLQSTALQCNMRLISTSLSRGDILYTVQCTVHHGSMTIDEYLHYKIEHTVL